MLVKTVAVAIVVACLVHGGQSLGGSVSTSTSSSSAAVFFNAAAGSSLSSNTAALNSSLAMMQMSVDNLNLKAPTQENTETAKFISKTLGKALKFAFKFIKALTNLATDKTIPIEELFQQFEKAYDKLITYMSKDEAAFKQSLLDNLGVAVARDVETKWKKIKQELMNVAANADRLKKAVLHLHNRHDESQGESRATISQMVTVFASSISKLKTAVADLTTAVGNIVTGLQTSNTFLTQVIGTRNSTRTSVKTARAELKKDLLKARMDALDKFLAAQSKIRTGLSEAIAKLSIFSTSKKLNRYARKFDDSYYELYHFLRQRNRTDASSIGRDFFRIWENLENVHDKSVEIFFYAMRRTYMRLADVVFESSFYNDYCHTTYTYSVPSKYQSVSTVISDCTTREKTRWMAISTAIKVEVTLLQSISEELAMNIARCATYKDFITSSPDYNQAEACLKTNLEDMRELSFQLKIHFTNLVNLVKAQVAPSKYRLENCFVTKLHEATALLKSTRESMNECSGRFDSHPRMGYEDDASDWYNRHLGEVCEGSDADSESVSNEAIDSAEAYDKTGFPEDIDRKPKVDTLVCKKRVDPVDTNEKTGNGSNSGNGGKDKKDKKGQDSGEGDSGELDSSEKKDKKDKKDKKNKHDKNKNDSEELDNEGGGEQSSEEKKDKKDKKDKKKPGNNKNSSEEDCSKEKKKDRFKEKYSIENSEEQFDRKKLKGYSDSESDIFNRKFGVQQPLGDALEEPAVPVADGILKRLLESPVAVEEEKEVDISVKVVGEQEEQDQAFATTAASVDAA